MLCFQASLELLGVVWLFCRKSGKPPVFKFSDYRGTLTFVFDPFVIIGVEHSQQTNSQSNPPNSSYRIVHRWVAGPVPGCTGGCKELTANGAGEGSRANTWQWQEAQWRGLPATISYFLLLASYSYLLLLAFHSYFQLQYCFLLQSSITIETRPGLAIMANPPLVMGSGDGLAGVHNQDDLVMASNRWPQLLFYLQTCL